jgi:hypothetical protein
VFVFQYLFIGDKNICPPTSGAHAVIGYKIHFIAIVEFVELDFHLLQIETRLLNRNLNTHYTINVIRKSTKPGGAHLDSV